MQTTLNTSTHIDLGFNGIDVTFQYYEKMLSANIVYTLHGGRELGARKVTRTLVYSFL